MSQYQEHSEHHLHSRTNKFSFYYLCFSSPPKLSDNPDDIYLDAY